MAKVERARKRVSIIEVNRKEIEANATRITEEEKCKNQKIIDTGPRFGCRHVQAILLCLGLIFGIGTRTNLSVAIVAMTDNTTSPNPDVPAYSWTNTSVILSSFFWSYITSQVLAGYLGKTYGPKYFLLTAFFINCVAVALTPLAAAKMGSGGVILCRIIQGFFQGFLYPSVHVMLGTWVPDEERATLSNFVFSGVAVGSMMSSILTGFISASSWGWPYSFYILALMGFLWCILWIIFGQNSPATHPRITDEEKKYIQSSLKQEEEIHLPIPWKKIFICLPFYAIFVAYVGNAWGYAILTTETPTYLAKVMNFNVKSNALLSAIPMLVFLAAGFITGPLSDWIISRNYISRLNVRRYFQIIGCYGQAVCLGWLSFLTESEAYTSIVCLSLGFAFAAFVLVGSSINHLDLSPRFSGILFGILNATGQAASIMAPLMAQWVIIDQTSIMQWRIVFLTSAGFFVGGATVFFFFATADRQSWDGPEDKNMEERRKKISVISLSAV
ncbi:unnamed protein product [Ceutorhynchus assimilis]|uniref:Putative inorganic phosphate cotransporter n=1 Tax=Ceutorhynchus assimilis TaxID=467358 RepID=A0A9N9MLP8_9CUCU|nr:unnamed protein product [Ceutorhynchus assimilis]